MTDRELMQKALGIMEWISGLESTPLVVKSEFLNALRTRLAQPEPLPAKSKGALSHEENKQHNKKILDKFYEENAHLYTAPPQREWQGLTDEEIKSAWSQLWYDLGNGKFAASDDSARHTTIMFAKEIEAKLKEKNT
jgi:hypothetical protein